jgi:hypothetical protein
MILHTDSVINLKAICFKFLGEVFKINRLFLGIYLNSRRLISILHPVLLLECSCVARIVAVTNTVD